MKKRIACFAAALLLLVGCASTPGSVSGSGAESIGSTGTPSQIEGEAVSSIHLPFSGNLALTEAGDVYAWGINEQGVLGLGLDEAAVVTTPTKVAIGEPVKTLWTHTNSNTVFAQGESGDIYAWGPNHSKILIGVDDFIVPSPVKLDFGFAVADLSFSPRFLTVSDTDGNLYGCGWDLTGSLMIEDFTTDYDAVSSDILQPLAENLDIQAYATSTLYRALLDTEGKVYVQGYLASHQMDAYNELTQIPFPEPIRKLGPMLDGLLCLAESGTLYFVGEDRFTIVGNDPVIIGDGPAVQDTLYAEPVKVTKLEQPILDIVCSSTNVLVETVDHEFYAWGKHVGVTDVSQVDSVDEFCAQPLRVDIPKDIRSYTCGEFSAAAIADDDTVYAWGSNGYYLIYGAGSIDPRPTSPRAFPTLCEVAWPTKSNQFEDKMNRAKNSFACRENNRRPDTLILSIGPAVWVNRFTRC